MYLPSRIIHARGLEPLSLTAAPLESAGAISVIAVGALVLLRCVWDFFAAGRGTLAPIDPPRHLVVRGLYRYTRNPMYNGVLAVLLGEAWLFHSLALLQFAALMFLIFHVFVIGYEEPALEAQFGERYRAYRAAVPRWGATVARR